MGGAYSTHGSNENIIKVLVGKPKEKRPLERSGWEDNIRMELKEIRWENTDWIHLAQNRG
jgi:hypothetical protein